jgi:hypothetical protein
MSRNASRSPACAAALVFLLGAVTGACGAHQGASSCAPPMLTIEVGSSSREAGSCPGVYRDLGTVRVKVGAVITAKAHTPDGGPPVLPESTDAAVVAAVSRSANGYHEKLKARAAGTTTLIVRTPLCPPQNFVTTPSPRVVGSKTESGPCRIMRIDVTPG